MKKIQILYKICIFSNKMRASTSIYNEITKKMIIIESNIDDNLDTFIINGFVIGYSYKNQRLIQIEYI